MDIKVLSYTRDKMQKETPMMKQYHRIKKRYSDSVLLFRLGDFYEMFENDATVASSILNITLTKRNDVPMCGFPYHAADTYIAKLIKNGKKIAICEQAEDPRYAQGIVKRDVVEIISPGIITDPNLLNNKTSNCIAAIYGFVSGTKTRIACASLDASTGEFFSNLMTGNDILDMVQNEIEDNKIREIIYPESFKKNEPFSTFFTQIQRTRSDLVLREVPDYLFEPVQAEEKINKQFSVAHADILEFQDEIEIIACGAVLAYVEENLKHELSHIRWIREKRNERILFIDNTTKKHLELTENQSDGSEHGTLLEILDRTQTAMGGRLMKKYIHNPSQEIQLINNRLQKVESFFNSANVLKNIRKYLGGMLDVERLISKISVGKGNARDLVGLKNSLQEVAKIKTELEEIEVFEEEGKGISDFSKIIETIEAGIVEDPPLSIKEGGMIQQGYNQQLDEYRKINLENREWINKYQAQEQKLHGIPSLKVRYNKIIGYYIEVTKPNLHLIPSNYMKKQTLVNAERFTTEELTEHEVLLNEARHHSNSLEIEIFEDIRSQVLDSMEVLYRASRVVSKLDVYCSLALVAIENNYVKPEIVEENIIDIKGGRHPVIEKIGEERFIENDLELNDTDRRIMILTGPNMAGKSTYLRQCALIIIMAHMGSYVPAQSARIGLTDRVFSRIGMMDRLVKGESTFLVEMIETSRILHYATKRSFIIMDEIGRGTSTYDGLAIAWAVLEYLLNELLVGAKVLFATHYHEMTAIEDKYGVINYNATVREWNNSVIFLRKIVPGSASRSYGVEVAKMAGIPDSIIERAKTILHGLENKYGSYVSLFMQNERSDSESGIANEQKSKSVQLGLFPSPYEIMAKELKGVDINNITPLEALNILDRLQKSIST